MADAFGTGALPFQIRVIEGDLSSAVLQAGQPPGTIQLTGRAGPFRPIKFGGKQRVQTVFYPGNPVGTQQPIGPTEEPTTLTGEWNDRYLGDGQARAIAELLDTIRQRALSVEVSWGDSLSGTPSNPQFPSAVGPIIRVGMITNFVATYERPQDVAWEAEFTWRSRGQTAAPMVSATAQINPRDGFTDVVSEIDITKAMWTAVQNGPQFRDVGLPQKVLDGMSRAFEALDTSVDAIRRATSSVVSAIVIPGAAAKQLIGACQNGLDAFALMISTMFSINLLATEVADDALNLVRIKDQLYQVLVRAGAASEVLHDNKNGVEVIIQPDVLASVRPPAGTDLRDLAAQYYGDPDLWWLIANFNNIDGSAVPPNPTGPSDDPGRPIQIPRVGSGTSADLRQQC